MRPRKLVYLYCRDEMRRSLMVTFLQVRATFATVVSFDCMDDLRSALKACAPGELFCVVMAHGGGVAEDFASFFAALPGEIGAMEVCADAAPPKHSKANVLLPRTGVDGKNLGIDHAELLERLKVLCARKRGPKKVPGLAKVRALAEAA